MFDYFPVDRLDHLIPNTVTGVRFSVHTPTKEFPDGDTCGLGSARAIYENFEALAERARDQLRDCHCGQPNGCPAYTFDENCDNDNKPLLRASAIDVLNQLLGAEDRDGLAEHLPDDEHGSDRRPVVFYS
ncbi:Zn-binding domain-containing protein [Halorussus halobius]|uniref:Zn-binding domain-containing protein n=1 Tax=Halorussus halobius TaxID=1710537 RepID=UPI003744A974